MILLAREIGEMRFLPAAYYLLYLLSLPHEKDKEPYKNLKPMSDHNKAIYFEGKQQLATIWPEFVQKEWAEPVGFCTDLGCCKDWKDMSDELQWRTLHPSNILVPDPLTRLKHYEETLDDCTTAICIEHRTVAKKGAQEKRTKVWDSLPGIF
ncbi:hypothetical protein K439DRAFT_1618759 [Ramaria rubella]|nr:hypothetical protein K439DRAFT_1618759 [Ramaria rubella]